MFKRSIGLLLALTVCLALFAGCGFSSDAKKPNAEKPTRKLTGVSAAFEFYDIEGLYEGGELSRQDLLNIAYYVNHETVISENRNKYPKNFTADAKTPEELSGEERSFVAEDYTALFGNEDKYRYEFLRYHGTYSGYTVVELVERNYVYPAVVVETKISDITVELGDPSHKLVAYKLNEAQAPETAEYEFFSLDKLCVNGELSRQDLLNLAYYCNNGISQANADQYPEDFVPTPKTPAELDEETQKAVMKAYGETLESQAEITNFRYLGKCGDYFAASVDVGSGWAWMVPYYVDGIEFQLSSSANVIVAFKAVSKEKTA